MSRRNFDPSLVLASASVVARRVRACGSHVGKTAGVVGATGGVGVPVGSLRRARQVFSEELARLGVILDERAALDGLLDEMTDQVGMSRQRLVRSYLRNDTVRQMARRAATEGSLQAASRAVAQDYPEAADWPASVRNYMIDHYAARSGAAILARMFFGEGAGVEELGLFRFRYGHPGSAAEALGSTADGTVAVVSAQHRSLVERGMPLVADGGWGRPEFEWAYELMLAVYRRRTGVDCDRLLWAWADSAMTAAAHCPHLVTAGARELLAGIAEPEAVAVVARVPVERCLFSSHIIWDGLVLRGRFIPTDIEDALCFHAAYGSTRIDDGDRRSVVGDAIVDSWLERFFWASADRSCDVRLQVCVDRIHPEEIIEVVDVDGHRAAPSSWMIDPGVDPRPLTAITPTSNMRLSR